MTIHARMFAFAILTLFPVAATAGHVHMSSGGFGGHHDRHHRGGHKGGDAASAYDFESLQSRFESDYEEIVGDYDSGIAEIEDYYASDEYLDLVDDMEWLVDRYDMFLVRVDYALVRLDDLLTTTGDELTYYSDLITDYEANNDLSEERLERILDWLTRIEESLTERVEQLTEAKSTLTANLEDYAAFDEEIDSYLDKILAAGGLDSGTTTEESEGQDEAAVALVSVASAADVCQEFALAASPSSTAVPEPVAMGSFLVAFAFLTQAVCLRRKPC